MNFCIISIYYWFEGWMYLYMLNATNSQSGFKLSHVTLTNPGSYKKNRYYGYCMIETSVRHSFYMHFYVSRAHCDNYREI
jgi:hypothetical protein